MEEGTQASYDLPAHTSYQLPTHTSYQPTKPSEFSTTCE
jgi:hypothetical protein